MPFLNPDQKMPMPSRPEPIHRPEIKTPEIKTPEKKTTFFQDKSQISRTEMKQDVLDHLKNYENFSQLKKKYGLDVNPWNLHEFAEEVVKEFPEKFGGSIDALEAKSADKELYRKDQQLLKSNNSSEFKHQEGVRKFLKDLEELK